MPSKHAVDNAAFGVRARLDWIAQLDAAAQKAGESRMAYIRKAVEERMAREEGKGMKRATQTSGQAQSS